MALSIGIVGLPNVGKSTLFNALLKEQQALAANYPFATIEPNVGVVPVPDERLEVLAKIVKTETIKPAMVEFVDIAGLVAGAHTGEGLGNKFLAHIRETAAICHVLRRFEDENVIREGAVDPRTDLEVVRLELQFADLATLEKQPEPKGSVAKADKERWSVILHFMGEIQAGHTIRQAIDDGALSVDKEVAEQVAKELSLLTAKPELFVINVSEKQLTESEVERMTDKYADEFGVTPSQVIVMCNQIESELAVLSDEDRQAYLADLGLKASGLDRLISSAYSTLKLQSFLTAGEKEVRAWTIPVGCTAQKAAGVIHTDFEKKMISAKVVDYETFVGVGGWKAAKDAGKVRTEGRDYVMQPDDIVEFLIGK